MPLSFAELFAIKSASVDVVEKTLGETIPIEINDTEHGYLFKFDTDETIISKRNRRGEFTIRGRFPRDGRVMPTRESEHTNHTRAAEMRRICEAGCEYYMFRCSLVRSSCAYKDLLHWGDCPQGKWPVEQS